MAVSKIDLTQRLAGKVAVITGAASGIGLAAAQRMRAEGATIVAGDIDPKTGIPAAEELGGLFVAVDVADEVAVNNLFDTAVATYGSVDIAFNNAGIPRPMTISSRPPNFPPGSGYRTSTSRACTCAAGRRCGIWCPPAGDPSSTPHHSLR